MDKIYDTAIIGGGAAGLSAAAFLIKNNYKNIVILEKENRVGKRILVSGNGRCNLTNQKLSAKNYHGDKILAESVIKKIDTNELLSVFNEFGLLTVADSEGRVYPYSGQASSVLDVLRNITSEYEICNFKVCKIQKNNGCFIISSENKTVKSKNLVIASGGKVQPKLGADGDSYDFARSFNHTVTECIPSLTPIYVNDKILQSLKGIRVKCAVNLVSDNKLVKAEIGEVQFNEDNLSGICVFNLSPLVNRSLSDENDNMFVQLKLLYNYKQKEIFQMLCERRKNFSDLPCSEIFVGMFNKRVGLALLKCCGIEHNVPIKTLKDEQLKILSKIVNDWRFCPKKRTDFNRAQVTAGGITSGEINFETLESKLVKGLYFGGEALNVDGECGGYNLHFAFSTGIIIAKSVLSRHAIA